MLKKESSVFTVDNGDIYYAFRFTRPKQGMPPVATRPQLQWNYE